MKSDRADSNPQPAGAHRQSDDALDRALDAALARYSAVEPRAGLEERVLANLRVQPTRLGGRLWWPWSVAAALAAVVVVAIALAWRPSQEASTITSNHPVQPERAISVTPVRGAEGKATRRHGPVPMAPTHVARPRKVVVENPKLDTFPSPQPLSAEEVALARYVRNFPKEAQLVAQGQQEFALETEKEMNDAGSESRPSSSIQQER